jgi:heme exporter protein A
MRLYAQNLTLDRGGLRLFSGISFDVRHGDSLVLQGANGAGKSSFLRALSGFLPFSSGTLRLENDGLQIELSENVHYLGHANALRSALTAHETLTFWAAMLGGDPRNVGEALMRLELRHVTHIPVRALSAGQKRRIALARLLIASKRLWLLDEPTTSLDSESCELFAKIMQEHLDGGGLIIAATHNALGVFAAQTIILDAKYQAKAGAAG